MAVNEIRILNRFGSFNSIVELTNEPKSFLEMQLLKLYLLVAHRLHRLQGNCPSTTERRDITESIPLSVQPAKSVHTKISSSTPFNVFVFAGEKNYSHFYIFRFYQIMRKKLFRARVDDDY